ncbi:glycosyltransferase family 1 protein [bacterium]|nr:glycosyltransferase family 1 protein [bacterium]
MNRRILFVGVFDVPWSDNIPLKRAFEETGNAVDVFNYRTAARDFASVYKPGSLHYKFIERLSDCLKLPFSPSYIANIGYTLNGRGSMNNALLKRVIKGGYDLVFIAKADIVNPSLISKIKRYADTWYFFMDPPDISFKMNAPKYAKAAARSSASCTRVLRSFKKAGARSFFIPEGVDARIFYPRESKKRWDVTFVGTRTWKRKRLLDSLQRYGIKVNTFGKGFPNGPVYTHDLAQLYRESKIILNLDRPGGKFSIRVFQAMGTGSMLLSTYTRDISLFFQRGGHLDWFTNLDECVKLIRFYLEDDDMREKIAFAGMQYVQASYSWERSAEKIFRVIEDSNSR